MAIPAMYVYCRRAGTFTKPLFALSRQAGKGLPRMNRLSEILFKLALMAGAFCAAALLLRDAMAISQHVPLDPNEGWNAYHALAAMSGRPLYPHDMMVNNYPPLSFYIVGALGRSLGDMILAGRLVSLLSFVAVAMGLAALVRQSDGTPLQALLASLIFATALLITSDYVAMDDPQLLGHALQIEALLLILRPQASIALAALLMMAGLFVKQNLFVLPLAVLLWLIWKDRNAAWRFCLYAAGTGIAGLAAAWIGLGVFLPAEIASPRAWSIGNLVLAAMRYGGWALPPLLATAWAGWRWRSDPLIGFCAIYALLSLAAGIGFSAGDGVDANIFFDLDIAMALMAGLALSRLRPQARGIFALVYAVPLALFLARDFRDANFAYTEGFARQGPLDVAFLTIAPGPALCESLALCYWADKPAEVDVFNLAEASKTGARNEQVLIDALNRRRYSAVQFASLDPFPLGEKARAALLANYRVHHIDDNGVFLRPR